MKKNLGKIMIIAIPVLMALYLMYPTYRATELTDIRNEQLTLSKSDLNLIDTLVNNKIRAFESDRTKAGLEFSAQLMSKVKDSLNAFVKDSIMTEKENRFNRQYGEAYESAKNNRIKLGLDLRGGMYVILEIDIVKLIEEAAQKDDIDERFDSVIAKTRQETENTDLDVIDVFYENFKAMASTGKAQLSDYFDYGDNAKDAGEVDKTIIEKLRENEKEAVDRSIEIIRQRIDKYGISEPTIQKLGTHRIMLEMPGVTNEKEMIDLIKTTARLEFHLVRNNEELIQSFYNIDKLLSKKEIDKKETVADTTIKPDSSKADSSAITKTKEKNKNKKAKADTSAVAKKDTTKSKDTSAIAATDTTKNDTAKKKQGESDSKIAEEHPFTNMFTTSFSANEQSEPQQFSYVVENLNRKGNYSFEITEDKLDEFNKLIKRGDIKELLPDDIIIMRGAKKQREINVDGRKLKVYDFYALKEEPELTGEVVTDAVATYDQQTNRPVVMMEMNSDGSEKWAKITGQNIKKRIAVVLDELVYTAPVVQNKITGGSSQITGMENAEEARLLQIVLKAGALQVPVAIKHKMFVGPSLGVDSINSGLTASALAVLLVIIFMLMYYKSAGFVANLSVIINVMIVIAILAAFHGTLSLPGIGGIILTIGMAVDANVLIYERIREELGKGRSMKSSIDEGFSKAMTAIIDSNITTLISGVILYYFGAGPIQGFALTLIIGIFATLFTQIVVSRAIIELWMSKGNTHFNFGQPKVTV